MSTFLRGFAAALCLLGGHACSTLDSKGEVVEPVPAAPPKQETRPAENLPAENLRESAPPTPPSTTGNDQMVPAIIGLPPTAQGDARTYRIGIDDLLRIEVFRVEDLSSEERVNEGGLISMPLIGPVQVGGLTPQEAEQQISERLRKYVRNPQVNLFVTEYASQNVTVSGAVKEPGLFPLKGRLTLMQAIAQAGGLNEVGNEEEIVLFRLQKDHSMQAYVINLEKIQEGILADPGLVSNDQIFVPESGSAVFIRSITGGLRGFVSFRTW